MLTDMLQVLTTHNAMDSIAAAADSAAGASSSSATTAVAPEGSAAGSDAVAAAGAGSATAVKGSGAAVLAAGAGADAAVDDTVDDDVIAEVEADIIDAPLEEGVDDAVGDAAPLKGQGFPLRGYQAVVLNPPWQQEGEQLPGRVVPADLLKLNLNAEVIPTGFVFIWVEKHVLSEVVDVLETMGFYYGRALLP